MILLAWAVMALSACGFHLRGSMALPEVMSVTFIKNNKPYGSLMDEFAEALRVHGVRVTDNPDEATAILEIRSDKKSKDVLSVNTAGKVLEFQLHHTVTFSVRTADDIPLVAAQRITVSRDYLYVSTDVLSKKREEAVVRRDMQKELVNMAMLRIAAAQ